MWGLNVTNTMRTWLVVEMGGWGHEVISVGEATEARSRHRPGEQLGHVSARFMGGPHLRRTSARQGGGAVGSDNKDRKLFALAYLYTPAMHTTLFSLHHLTTSISRHGQTMK